MSRSRRPKLFLIQSVLEASLSGQPGCNIKNHSGETAGDSHPETPHLPLQGALLGLRVRLEDIHLMPGVNYTELTATSANIQHVQEMHGAFKSPIFELYSNPALDWIQFGKRPLGQQKTPSQPSCPPQPNTMHKCGQEAVAHARTLLSIHRIKKGHAVLHLLLPAQGCIIDLCSVIAMPSFVFTAFPDHSYVS